MSRIVDVYARAEMERIRGEEGTQLASIRYFSGLSELRLLVITSRINGRLTEFTPKTRSRPPVVVIRATPEEWQERRLDLVPREWREDPVLVY